MNVEVDVLGSPFLIVLSKYAFCGRKQHLKKKKKRADFAIIGLEADGRVARDILLGVLRLVLLWDFLHIAGLVV